MFGKSNVFVLNGCGLENLLLMLSDNPAGYGDIDIRIKGGVNDVDDKNLAKVAFTDKSAADAFGARLSPEFGTRLIGGTEPVTLPGVYGKWRQISGIAVLKGTTSQLIWQQYVTTFANEGGFAIVAALMDADTTALWGLDVDGRFAWKEYAFGSKFNFLEELPNMFIESEHAIAML